MDPAREHDNRIRRHYEEMWGPPLENLKLGAGPEHELPDLFRVLLFAPSNTRSMWSYATSSMSIPQEERGLEVHLITRERDDTVVELLTVVAHYHRTGATLDLGHTVNFGRPWLKTSKAEFGLLSLPYLDGPLLEWLPIANRRIRFLWILPLLKAEVAYRKQFGTEKLEQLLEKKGLNYLDPKRPSVV